MGLIGDRLRLDSVQERLVESLRQDGIAVASFEELFAGEEHYANLEADIAGFVYSTESRLDELREREISKSYIVRRFSKKDGSNEAQPRFGLSNGWLRLGISDRLLSVVNTYRGEHTQLIEVDNWYTIPDPQAETRAASQRWHRDPHDDHIVKMFVYFNDVDQDAGPFEYLRGSPTGGRYGDLWPWISKGIYPPQEEFAAAIDQNDVLTVTGTAGTVIVADTGGFHRGGWARTRPRVLATYTYVSSNVPGGKRFKLDRSEGEPRSKQARAAIA